MVAGSENTAVAVTLKIIVIVFMHIYLDISSDSWT
jgi:hypothetical protein